MDFLLQPRRFARKFFRQPRQLGAINLDAMTFHAGDDRHEGPIDALIDSRAAFNGESGLEQFIQTPGYVGVFRGIFRRLVERHFTEGNRLLPGAAYFLEGKTGVAKVAVRKLVHPVSAADAVELTAGVQIEADDHRIFDRGYRNAIASEDVEVVFAVVEDFRNGIACQQWSQSGERGSLFDLLRPFGKHVIPAMTEGDVACIVRTERQADPDQIAQHAIE